MADPTEDRSPRRLGAYELLEEIARGGMGVVYRARQVSLDRIVAVKVVLAGRFAGREQTLRFRAEAEAAARLQHPNIVAIHETGEQEGQPYFSMDYVPGGNLAALVREKPLPAKAAARLVRTLAEAVHYAHEQGILHRDLKPSNILLDDAGQPRITDFGLARRVEKDSFLTVTGQVLGSPNFMPPEQAGAKLKSGRHSDVYALGGILFHLLTGRPPFLAETVPETLQQVLQHEPVSPRLLNPSVPEDLATLCLKCLEKEPGRRYATATELAKELARFLQGEPVQARPVGRAVRVWRWGRRRPALASLAVLLGLAVVLGVSGILWQWQRAERERRVAQASEQTALERTYAAEMLQAQRAVDEGNLRLAESLLDKHHPGPGKPDLRGWEWRYLWQQTRSEELRLLQQFPEAAYGVTLSPDGHQLAVAVERRDGGVWVCNLHSGELTRVTDGNATGSVQFSPDGTRLAFGATEGQVVVLNWPARKELARFPVAQSVRSGFGLAFSPDGKLLATGDEEGRVRLWELESRRELWNRSGPPWGVTSLAFTPDGHTLASGFQASDIQVREVASGRLLKHLTNHTGAVQSLAFSPDGRTLVSGSWDRSMNVWELPSGRLLTHLTAHTAWVGAVVFSRDGSLLASGSADYSIKLWNPVTWQEIHTLKGNRDEVFGLTFSPDGRRLYSASKDGSLREWSAVPWESRRDSLVWPHQRFVLADRFLAVWQTNRYEVWDAMQLRPVDEHSLNTTPGDPIRSLGVSPLGDWVALATEAGELLLRTVPGTSSEVRLKSNSSGYQRLGFSPSGRRLAAVTGDGDLEVWDVANRVRLHRLRPGNGHPRHHRFAPDERSLAVAVGEGPWGDGTVEVWSLPDERRVAAWRAGKGDVMELVFLSGGRTLVTATGDAQLQAWEYPPTRKDPRPLAAKRTMNSFNAVALSPDGRRLAAGTYNGFIHLWDADSFLEVATFRTEDGDIRAVSFSPDGNTLTSVGRRLRLWPAPSWNDVAAETSGLLLE
ncbi:MAG: serine/threonine protein kinase [Verrucomicrobiae bacterium]|nr:serine/threonine protein kinase [Verrucomicrobiae bacterium]